MSHPAIRFIRFLRPKRRGISRQRLAAAKRAIASKVADAKSMLPMFRDEALAEIPTPEERIESFDDRMAEYWQNMRDLHAKHWIEARHRLRLMDATDLTRCVTAWNASAQPASSTFFLEFVKRWPELRAELDADVSEERIRISDKIRDWTPATELTPRERLDAHELTRRGLAQKRWNGNTLEWRATA